MNKDETSPSGRKHCAHFVLAQGVVAQVEYCVACAIFHVSVESMSIRFCASALRDLRDTLSKALTAYEQAAKHVAEQQSGTAQRDGLH